MNVPSCILFWTPHLTFPEMDSLCFCASDAIIAVTISLDTLAVSMPCSSNRTLTPSSLSSRTAARQSFVFRAKREMDLTRMRSIFPLRQSA
jgi:hypothetical protein